MAPSLKVDAAVEDSGETRVLERAEIEARLKAAKAAPNPDDAASGAAVDLDQEALGLFESAKDQRVLLDSYVADFASAPEATKKAQATREATPQLKSGDDLGGLPPPGLTTDASIDEMNNRLTAARSAEFAAKKELEDLAATVVLQQTRPEMTMMRSVVCS